jgi:hypothetical protein
MPIALIVFATNSPQRSPLAFAAGVVFCAGIVAALRWRYVFTPRGRKRVLYVVTTDRVARVERRLSGEQIDSIMLDELPTLSLATTKGGRGTINFGLPPAALSPKRWRGRAPRAERSDRAARGCLARPSATITTARRLDRTSAS